MTKKLLCIVLFLVVASGQLFAAKPNILFIAVDDMNDWVGPLGGLDIAKTPGLDRLAAEGVTFTNAHCASPACASSRLANMTGVQPSKSGVMKNVWYDGPQWRKIPLLSKIETVEQFFRNRGYETLAGGKIYHSLAPPWLTSNHADPDGWDFYYPSISVPMAHQISAPEEVINPEHFTGWRHRWFTWGPIQAKDEKMIDHQLVDWVEYELNRPREHPVYLACGIFRPHMPWEVPQKYFDLYPSEEIPDLVIQSDDLNDAFLHNRRNWHKFVLENKQWKQVIQAYLASVSFADAQIMRLLDALEASGKADNTIVVLWSDHGMHIGEKENWEKFTLWEESTRVPFLLKVPGISNPGTSISEPVSLLDIYPTLVELTGFDVPVHCDGQSVVPLMKDPGAKRRHCALTSFEFPGGEIGHSLRGVQYRYIFYEDSSFEELYDHKKDPHEHANIAYDPRYTGIVESMRDELVLRTERFNLADIRKDPIGYRIENGRIKAESYIPLSDVLLPSERDPVTGIR